MSKENKEKIADESISAIPLPAIGEPQSPAMGSMDLENLPAHIWGQLWHIGIGVINTVPQPGRLNTLALETWFNKRNCQP